MNIVIFKTERKRLKALEIRLLPAWLLNHEVLRINPDDYESLKAKIRERISGLFSIG